MPTRKGAIRTAAPATARAAFFAKLSPRISRSFIICSILRLRSPPVTPATEVPSGRYEPPGKLGRTLCAGIMIFRMNAMVTQRVQFRKITVRGRTGRVPDGDFAELDTDR